MKIAILRMLFVVSFTVLPLLFSQCRNVSPITQATEAGSDSDSDADSDVDVDADGDSDTETGTGTSTGDALCPGFVEHSIGESTGAVWVDAVDMDMDGDLDVEFFLYAGDTLGWWENEAGDASSWVRHPIAEGFEDVRGMGVVDIDGDGDLDTVSASTVEGLGWWENLSGDALQWQEKVIDPNFLDNRKVVATDLDGDGDGDVLVYSELTSQSVAFWMENVDGMGQQWSFWEFAVASPELKNTHVHDLDGDGDKDLVGVTSATALSWLENIHGDASQWSIHTVVDENVFENTSDSRVVDLNDDGLNDILLMSWESGSWGEFDGGSYLWWIENLGGSVFTWQHHAITYVTLGASGMDAADFDMDGSLDVLAVEYEPSNISWWRTSDWIMWHRQEVDNFGISGARNARAFDLDGDGDDDILAVTDNGIRWFENRCM